MKHGAAVRPAAWRDHAVCRTDPERWFSRNERTTAMHVCRSHCPVVEQCLQSALARPPHDGVQGGIVFNIHANPFPDWFYKPVTSCPDCPAVPPEGRCGTYKGYRWHLRHGEPACQPCRTAGSRRRLEWRSGPRESA